jgi:hypothetical protein
MLEGKRQRFLTEVIAVDQQSTASALPLRAMAVQGGHRAGHGRRDRVTP